MPDGTNMLYEVAFPARVLKSYSVRSTSLSVRGLIYVGRVV